MCVGFPQSLCISYRMPTSRDGFRCLRCSLAGLVAEGLAVIVSSSGGAKGVTREQARVRHEAGLPALWPEFVRTM